MCCCYIKLLRLMGIIEISTAVLFLAYIAHACWNASCTFEVTGKQSAKDLTAFRYYIKKKSCKIGKYDGNKASCDKRQMLSTFGALSSDFWNFWIPLFSFHAWKISVLLFPREQGLRRWFDSSWESSAGYSCGRRSEIYINITWIH